MMQQDENNIQLQIKDKITQKTISQIEGLLRGEKIEIKEGEEISLRLLSFLLGNEEMYNKISESCAIKRSESAIDTFLEELKILNIFSSLSKDFNYSSIIDIIASNFYSIDQQKLLQFPKSTLYSIISNKNLKLDNEDSLLDFIDSIFKKNEEELNESKKEDQNDDINITMFYEHVQFCMLDSWRFLNFLNNFRYYEMTNDLWRSLVKCFHVNYNESINEQNCERYKLQFKYDDENENFMHGIIYSLIKQSPFFNEVSVSSSTQYLYAFSNEEKYRISNVINYDDESYFETNNEKNSWIMFDFSERNVKPEYYTIKLAPSTKNLLQSWCIEGSNTNTENGWEILDSHYNAHFLDENNLTHTFQINTKNDYRYLRIRQTGKNKNNNYILSISALEFYGDATFRKQI